MPSKLKEAFEARLTETAAAQLPALRQFDATLLHVMEARDNDLIADQVMHGALSEKFVYHFVLDGSKVAGISVGGAAHLTHFYGGLKHRIIASAEKRGKLYIFRTYDPPNVAVQVIPELEGERDHYEAVVEVTDLKTGNSIQVAKGELAVGKRKDGSTFQRPNFTTIAESKAYRNAVLRLIPQDVQAKFMQRCLAEGKALELTEDAFAARRADCVRFAAKHGVALSREALPKLTWQQLTGLAESAALGEDAFKTSAKALELTETDEGEEKSTRRRGPGRKTKAEKEAAAKADADAAAERVQGGGGKPAETEPTASPETGTVGAVGERSDESEDPLEVPGFLKRDQEEPPIDPRKIF